MTTLRQAAQQALEALECMIDDLMYKDHKRVIDISNVAITALRTALEQQQAEPPPEGLLIKNIIAEYGLDAISFVAEWKAAQRQPLTDKQILADETLRYYFGQNGGAGPVSKQGRKVVDAIEAAHGIGGEA